MRNFPMKRRIKYALAITFEGCFSKTDRQHLLTKCKKRSMRRFIQREAEQEISEELQQKLLQFFVYS